MKKGKSMKKRRKKNRQSRNVDFDFPTSGLIMGGEVIEFDQDYPFWEIMLEMIESDNPNQD